MADYREQKRGNLIILWDEAEGIGIRFELHPDKKREYSLALKDINLLMRHSMTGKITGIVQRIKAYAEIKYPTAGAF